MTPVFLTHNTTFAFLPAAKPVKVILSWSGDDPLAVTISFTTARQAVDWTVSRDLLLAGLDGPAGLGDVSVLPDLNDPGRLELILSPPSGRSANRSER